MIAGPMLDGLLYALDPTLTYSMMLSCLVLAQLTLAGVPVRCAFERQATDDTAWQRFTAGIDYIRSRPVIPGVISLDLFAVLFGRVVVLLAVYAHKMLHVGSQKLGTPRSAVAAGAFLIGLYLKMRAIRCHAGL